jgi:hypothetical protein
MERELRDVMSMLPRLDYSDPVAARSEMNRFIRLSTMLGSHTLTDSEVDVVDRICPSDGTCYKPGVRVELHHYPETFHAFDTTAASEVSRRARREQPVAVVWKSSSISRARIQHCRESWKIRW